MNLSKVWMPPASGCAACPALGIPRGKIGPLPPERKPFCRNIGTSCRTLGTRPPPVPRSGCKIGTESRTIGMLLPEMNVSCRTMGTACRTMGTRPPPGPRASCRIGTPRGEVERATREMKVACRILGMSGGKMGAARVLVPRAQASFESSPATIETPCSQIGPPSGNNGRPAC